MPVVLSPAKLKTKSETSPVGADLVFALLPPSSALDRSTGRPLNATKTDFPPNSKDLTFAFATALFKSLSNSGFQIRAKLED